MIYFQDTFFYRRREESTVINYLVFINVFKESVWVVILVATLTLGIAVCGVSSDSSLSNAAGVVLLTLLQEWMQLNLS